jgi:hypothetical protein
VIDIVRSSIGGRACLFGGLIVLALLVPLSAVRSTEEVGCPAQPDVTINSPVAPADVCIPDGFSGNPIRYFDDFSWRTFVAMVWPVKQGQRGEPDQAKKVSDSGIRVFETFKNDWEVFRPDGTPPSDWNIVDQKNPCGDLPTGDDLVLASFSKFGNLGEAGVGQLVHALPAQNKTWTRYATGFNRQEFEQIVQKKLYLRASLTTASVTFKSGAIDLKAAWIEMVNISHPERYYTRTALTLDPVSGKCTPKTVGLVGLHIVQKTPSRPQWIWSSFEQIDNVPPSPENGGFAFNDASGNPMPAVDPNGGFPPADWANPKIYNVARIKPIHASTAQTNAAYQQKIGGVWQFYRLILTQWPLQINPPNPIPATQSGGPKSTFPGLSTDQSSFANTTLETWDQNKVTTSCMACHAATQTETDFVWALPIHAFPPVAPLAPRALARLESAVELPPSLQRLKAILTEANKNARENR